MVQNITEQDQQELWHSGSNFLARPQPPAAAASEADGKVTLGQDPRFCDMVQHGGAQGQPAIWHGEKTCSHLAAGSAGARDADAEVHSGAEELLSKEDDAASSRCKLDGGAGPSCPIAAHGGLACAAGKVL